MGLVKKDKIHQLIGVSNFFCIFGFPVSQNVKKCVLKKTRLFDKLIIKNDQNELLFHYDHFLSREQISEDI